MMTVKTDTLKANPQPKAVKTSKKKSKAQQPTAPATPETPTETPPIQTKISREAFELYVSADNNAEKLSMSLDEFFHYCYAIADLIDDHDLLQAK
jgi:hypothetical protein